MVLPNSLLMHQQMLLIKLITKVTNSTQTTAGEALTSEVGEEAEEEEECLNQHAKFATRLGTQL